MAETSVAERRLRPESARAAGGGRSRRRLQPQGLPWILPALVLSIGLIYYCIWYTAVISTWDWDGIDPNPERVGAENYVRISQDPIFWRTIQHTIVFFVVTFVVQTALGFIFAVLLHSKVKLAVVYKVIIFIPVVLAPAITAPVFRRIFAPDGQFNWLLEHVGLGRPGATVARPGKHRAPGDHGGHRVALDRSDLCALLRGDGADRPVPSRGGPYRRRRQLPHAGPHHLAGRAGARPSPWPSSAPSAPSRPSTSPT